MGARHFSKKYIYATKKAIRAISSAGYNAHTEPLFKLYNVLKVEDIYMGARRNFSRGGQTFGGGGPKKSVKGGPHIFLDKL